MIAAARKLLPPLCAALALLLSGCSVVDTLLDSTAAPEATPADASIVVVTDTIEAEETAAPEAASPEEAQEPGQNPEQTPEAAASEESEDAEEAVPENELLSTTTGRPLPEGSVYRPVLVVVDNAAQARPQTALLLADIVYEFPLDRTDHGTRYLAVFSDELPERVGPVRTSRAYLAETALEWGGLYVSLGDPELADAKYPLLAQSGVRFRAENSDGAANFFYRDKTISSLEEYTSFFKLRDYVEANYNFSVASSTSRFTFEEGVTYDKGKTFVSVGVPFTSSDPERVVFTYDAGNNLLLRSDKNSKNVLGQSTSLTPTDNVLGYENEPVAVQNLIVQYVHVSSYDKNYRSVSLIGSGDCMYFVNGRAVSGKWSRPSLGEPTTYKLYDGTLLRLEPGSTWIMMMPNKNEIKIRYAG